MPRSADDLDAFIREQSADTLAALLIELACEHEPVRQRLLRLKLAGRPDKLASNFRKSLTAWRRSSRFLSLREADQFGADLESWLGQVERELLPKDPMATVELVEAFIESDGTFFERADDSDGAIGDAVRAGCRLWLMAAAQCESPRDAWPARLARLASGDDYGAREELWRRANLLLDDDQLRGIAADLMEQLERTMARAHDAGHLPTGIFGLSASLSLLAQALRDPDVHVKAVLSYSPQPNPRQMESFVQDYLAHDRPADALRWLEASWGHDEASRLSLRADALARLGRATESAGLREQLFRQTLAVDDLQQWLESLPPGEQGGAIAEARLLAQAHRDPVVAACVLIEAGDDGGAEARLVPEPGNIRGEDYGTLVPLAQALEAGGRWSGATAVYRALLDAILQRGYARAYSHGARYLIRLRAISAQSRPAESRPHADYEAELLRKHGRKASFWAHVTAAAMDGGSQASAG